MPSNKEQLISSCVEKLRHDLSSLETAVREAHESATDEENIPENKYDTLALEASYLAEGQSRRLEELKGSVSLFENMTLVEFDERTKISLSALVTIESEEGEERTVFLANEGGGLNLEWQGRTVTVMTPQTPIAQAVLGQYLGDYIEIELADKIEDFEITGLE